MGRYVAVESTVIRGYRYDAAKRELHIRFTTGRDYAYLDVPPEEVEALEASPSKGGHVNVEIKPRYACRELP